MKFLLPFLVNLAAGSAISSDTVPENAMVLATNGSFVAKGVRFVTGCLPTWPEFEKTGNVTYDAEFEARVMEGLVSAGCPPLQPPVPKDDEFCDWQRRERYEETSGNDYNTYPCHFCHATDGIGQQYEFCIGASLSAGLSAEAVSAGLGIEISYCVSQSVSCNKNPGSRFICLRSEVPRRASSGRNHICQGRGCNAPPNCWTNDGVSVDYIKRKPHFWCDNRNDLLC